MGSGQRADTGRLDLLLQTGYGEFWPDKKGYLGTDRTGQEAVAELHFPGLDPAAADWLVKK